MKTILCFGDSNTWGYVPGSGRRYAAHQRWPGVCAAALGDDYRLIEEGLNGRTTVLDDPTRPGRNGATYLRPCLDSHAPLDLVVLMLGTNDLKHRFGLSAFDIAANVGTLVTMIRQPILQAVYPPPRVLLVSPPHTESLTVLGEMFAGAVEKSQQLARHYRDVANLHGCAFVDAAEATAVSPVDGVHLDETGQRRLGERLAVAIREVLGEG